jgi:hypothetical protein
MFKPLVSTPVEQELKKYDHIDMDVLAKETNPSYYMLGCTYIGKKCERHWKMVMTMYGRCLEFTPWNTDLKLTIGRQVKALTVNKV